MAPLSKESLVKPSTLLTWVHNYEKSNQEAPGDGRRQHQPRGLFDDEELRAEFEERLRACVRDKMQRMCIDVVREMVDKWLDEMVGGDELRK